MTEAFDSPLRVRGHTEFSTLGFGAVEAAPGVAALRREMNVDLFAVADALPAPLAAEARAQLAGYTGGDGDFFRLFYVPAWSFLHWVPAAAPRLAAPGVLDHARTAHALALFLHLWDDHLCDGQLSTDLLRLHLRTLAWERFAAEARALGRALGSNPARMGEHAAEYLDALHRPGEAAELDAYGARFVRQIATWTLVPRLLGEAVGGAPEEVVARFGVAWRLMDDVQDTHLDAAAGARTAVWLALDAEGRARWDDARAAAGAAPDPRAWQALAPAVRAPGCLDALRARIGAELRRAEGAARAGGWDGWADELAACARGSGPAAPAREEPT